MRNIISSTILAAGAFLAWRLSRPAKPAGYCTEFSRGASKSLWLYKQTGEAWIVPWAKLFRVHYDPVVPRDKEDRKFVRNERALPGPLEQMRLIFMDGTEDCIVTIRGLHLGGVMQAVLGFRLSGLSEWPQTLLDTTYGDDVKEVPVIITLRVETVF